MEPNPHLRLIEPDSQYLIVSLPSLELCMQESCACKMHGNMIDACCNMLNECNMSQACIVVFVIIGKKS